MSESEMELKAGLDGWFWRYNQADGTFQGIKVGPEFHGPVQKAAPPRKRQKGPGVGRKAKIEWTLQKDYELAKRVKAHDRQQDIACHFGISRSAIASRIAVLRETGVLA
jgi:hypothetical protein